MKKIKDKALNDIVFKIYNQIGMEIEKKYFTKCWYPFKYSREFISKTIMRDKQIFSFIIQFSALDPEKQIFFFKTLAYLGNNHSYYKLSHTKSFTMETLNIDSITKEIINIYESNYRSAEDSK